MTMLINYLLNKMDSIDGTRGSRKEYREAISNSMDKRYSFVCNRRNDIKF